MTGTPDNKSAGISWKRGFPFCLLLLGLYWLYGWRPLLVQPWSTVDDGLYIHHAEAFLDWIQGNSPNWLGSFDRFTLVKAPLFGVWLALLHLLGIPLRVGEFLLLMSSSFLFRSAVSPIRKLGGLEFAVVVFLIVANPLYPVTFRLNRDSLQISLTNLCLISAVGLALRAHGPMRARICWALMTGLYFGLCYLNREEAIWVFMAVSVAMVLSFAKTAIPWRRCQKSLLSVFEAQGVVLLALALGFLPPVFTVCALNKQHYGVFLTTFRRSSAFTELYQRLTSLEPNDHQAYVPIAWPTRMKAYELSPSFAKLKPFLEEPGSYWTAGNRQHAMLNGRSPSDKEFFISYFEFCLFDAVNQAGAKTADQMEAMFRNIDRELGDAIREKKIQAGIHGPAILAAPRAGDFKKILSAWWLSFSSLMKVNGPPYNWPLKLNVPQDRLDDMSRLTHSSVVLYPNSNMLYPARETVFLWIKKFQRIVFPLLFPVLFGLLVWKRKDVFTPTPSPMGFFLWTVAVPLSGLAAFCLSMAVVEVLGFRFIDPVEYKLPGYNMLGFAPLSVLCACVFVGVIGSVSRAPDALQEDTLQPIVHQQ